MKYDVLEKEIVVIYLIEDIGRMCLCKMFKLFFENSLKLIYNF